MPPEAGQPGHSQPAASQPTASQPIDPVRELSPGGVVLGSDGLARSPWAYGSPQLRAYYDEEWGLPLYGEAELFERVSLEGFQAGLSWATILAKRVRFREVFSHFDAEAVAGYGARDVELLVADAGIIRHRGKIEACIANARAVVNLRADGGLTQVLWAAMPATTPTPTRASEVPTTSAESVALSKKLKQLGFRFVGPTTMFALMEAVGMVDTHLLGSHRRGASGLWKEDGSRA